MTTNHIEGYYTFKEIAKKFNINIFSAKKNIYSAKLKRDFFLNNEAYYSEEKVNISFKKEIKHYPVVYYIYESKINHIIMTDEDIKEMLFKMTRTTCGRVLNGYQDLDESLQRYKYFKEWLKTEIPDFSTEEIIKYYKKMYQIKRLFDFSGHGEFLTLLEKEKL